MTNHEKSPLITEINQGLLRAQELFAVPDSPVLPTDLRYDDELSERYGADIYLASELHQPVQSYKIRGAWNFVSQLAPEELAGGLVTTSAGNHSRAVALAASRLEVPARIFMPETTPAFKVAKTLETGGSLVEIELVGETFDDAETAAREHLEANGGVYLPPFDHPDVIAGQGTLAAEIFDRLPDADVLLVPVGGGGLISGCAVAAKAHNPGVVVIGAEPAGAASMQHSLRHGKPTSLDHIDTTVDGAAVKKPGIHTFELASVLVDRVLSVGNHDVRRSVTELWGRDEPIKTELAGGLTPAALEQLSSEIVGKTVVCLITGGSLSEQRFEEEVRLPAPFIADLRQAA